MTNRPVLACLMLCGLGAAARAQDATAFSFPSLALSPPASPRLDGRAANVWSQYYKGSEGDLGHLLDPFVRGRLYSLDGAGMRLKRNRALPRLAPSLAQSGVRATAKSHDRAGHVTAAVEEMPAPDLKRAEAIAPLSNITITPGLMVTIDNGAGRGR